MHEFNTVKHLRERIFLYRDTVIFIDIILLRSALRLGVLLRMCLTMRKYIPVKGMQALPNFLAKYGTFLQN